VSGQPSELLRSFRAFIEAAAESATILAIEERNLKALHDLCIERAKRFCGKDGVISMELSARGLQSRGKSARWSGCVILSFVLHTGKACSQHGSRGRRSMSGYSAWPLAFE
jgi:hypothetical protein